MTQRKASAIRVHSAGVATTSSFWTIEGLVEIYIKGRLSRGMTISRVEYNQLIICDYSTARARVYMGCATNRLRNSRNYDRLVAPLYLKKLTWSKPDAVLRKERRPRRNR